MRASRIRFAFVSALALVALSAFAACGSFSSDSPSTPVVDAAVAEDATSPPADGPIPLADATVDAPRPPPPCPISASHCDNFERDSGLQGGWNGVPTSDGGNVALVLDHTTSSTGFSSLRASGDKGSSALRRDLKDTLDVLEVSFHLRIDVVPTASSIVAQFVYTNLTAVNFVVSSNGVKISEQIIDSDANTYHDEPPVGYPTGKWVPFTFSIKGKTATLVATGVTPPISITHTLVNPVALPKALTLGLPYLQSQTGPFTAWFDDVAVH